MDSCRSSLRRAVLILSSLIVLAISATVTEQHGWRPDTGFQPHPHRRSTIANCPRGGNATAVWAGQGDPSGCLDCRAIYRRHRCGNGHLCCVDPATPTAATRGCSPGKPGDEGATAAATARAEPSIPHHQLDRCSAALHNVGLGHGGLSASLPCVPL